ncbi:MAG: hypothetical protein Q8S20_08660 [Sulfuritalea sp.]|nr:hypothetical protein [Sulfuritalea sp.]
MDIAAVVGVVGSVASAIATIILAVLTGRYVRLTNSLVEEAKAAKFPNVYVDIEFDSFEVRFIVGNAGSMPATNIRFQVTDNVPWRKMEKFESGFESVSAIRSGISYLAPGRILKYNAGFVDRDPAFFSDTSSIEILLTFETDSGVTVKREFAIELRAYSGVLLESFTHPEREVAKAIRDAESHRASRETTKTIFTGRKKRCTFCGESISIVAKKCPHCLEFLPEQETDPE